MDLRRKKKIIILSGLVTLLFLASYQISNYINKTNKPPPNFGKSNIESIWSNRNISYKGWWKRMVC